MADLIKNHADNPLVFAQIEELVSHAIEQMKFFKISQIPLKDVHAFVDSIGESISLHNFIADKNIVEKSIKDIRCKTYPVVKITAKLEAVSKLINKQNQTVLVDLENGNYQIITKYDIIGGI